ncbi:MAG: serine hydrolase [Verrucomicrobiae bacterium]|nr:serine hydrolase [Verrucomicrobiae bacterium]
MKPILPTLLTVLILLGVWHPPLHAASKKKSKAAPRKEMSLQEMIKAKGVLLVDAASDKTLFERNAHQEFLAASTVKIMTALIVYEKTKLLGSIKVTREDTRVEPSHVPLVPGEVVSVEKLTHALLIGSDNDCAMSLARHVAGSKDLFVELMNERARELGCQDTRFCNPNGLPGGSQYTTAHDLLLIFRKALSYPVLRKIMMTEEYRLTTKSGRQTIKNHNRLLGRFNGMGPAKTGWTIRSRHTYAASATRDGRELQLILLNSPDKWTDARILLDYGFRTRTEPAKETVTAAKPVPPTPAPGK